MGVLFFVKRGSRCEQRTPCVREASAVAKPPLRTAPLILMRRRHINLCEAQASFGEAEHHAPKARIIFARKHH